MSNLNVMNKTDGVIWKDFQTGIQRGRKCRRRRTGVGVYFFFDVAVIARRPRHVSQLAARCINV
jgi:hypothetical protein